MSIPRQHACRSENRDRPQAPPALVQPRARLLLARGRQADKVEPMRNCPSLSAAHHWQTDSVPIRGLLQSRLFFHPGRVIDRLPARRNVHHLETNLSRPQQAVDSQIELARCVSVEHDAGISRMFRRAPLGGVASSGARIGAACGSVRGGFRAACQQGSSAVALGRFHHPTPRRARC
jgi:hypothetical protein